MQVAETYIEALEARASRGEPIDTLRSVASFFVSRVDTIVDDTLDSIAKTAQADDPAKAEKALSLRGQFGIANCREAYQRFRELFGSDRFKALAEKGARPQRPLWASTSTKNPAYRDVLYIEQLIGADTVNTIPHDTLEAFVDHGDVAETVTSDVEKIEPLKRDLGAIGVDLSGCLETLQKEGVKKFADSFEALNQTLREKSGLSS